MGAGPHPTRPRRHLWEKTSTVKLKDENEETHEFQNFVAQVGSTPKPAEANTKSTVRLTLTRLCPSFCFVENFVSLLATALRKYLFLTQITYVSNVSPLYNWYPGFYPKSQARGLFVCLQSWLMKSISSSCPLLSGSFPVRRSSGLAKRGLTAMGVSVTTRWGGPWWGTNAAVSPVLKTAAKWGGIFMRGKIFSGFEMQLEEKLNAEKAFSSCRGKGTPKGLQRGGENVIYINISQPAKAGKLSSCYCLLAILWNYGKRSPLWFCSRQSGVQCTSVGSGDLKTVQTRSRILGTGMSFALSLSKRVNSPKWWNLWQIFQNFQQSRAR